MCCGGGGVSYGATGTIQNDNYTAKLCIYIFFFATCLNVGEYKQQEDVRVKQTQRLVQ